MKAHHIRKIKLVSEFLISESVQLDAKSESRAGAGDDTLFRLMAIPCLASENASLLRRRLIRQQVLDRQLSVLWQTITRCLDAPWLHG